jgi:uncharacterized membrane protein YgdD (TMEM256/DUF423 family)
MNARWWLFCGALVGAVGVTLGAYGAHGLERTLNGMFGDDPASVAKRIRDWDTAVRYQLVHAVALLAVGLARARWQSRLLDVAGGAFLVGVVLFSGCLYALSLSTASGLGHAVMVGGMSYTVGWLTLAAAAARLRGDGE